MSDSGANQRRSQGFGEELEAFVKPLVVGLDECLDKRLVRIFVRGLIAIVTFRHSLYGLLLSELGGFITSPEQAPAGTKRLSNLLRSANWSAQLIEQFRLMGTSSEHEQGPREKQVRYA